MSSYVNDTAFIIGVAQFESTKYKRVSIQRKVQLGICVQRRNTAVCASTQADQSLSFPPEETLNL